MEMATPPARNSGSFKLLQFSPSVKRVRREDERAQHLRSFLERPHPTRLEKERSITTAAAMAKLQSLPLIALLCLISAIAVVAQTNNNQGDGSFQVQGTVYCDTCRAGFVTIKTEYISGAKVKIECNNRTTHKMTYQGEGQTDPNGTYTMSVPGDHEDDVCEVILVSSPVAGCTESKKPLDRARVMLTYNNGISSDFRYANALGFVKDKPLDGCSELLAKYVLSDETVF
ncbi:hypothetical protein ACLOJK_025150 [Asimina triloba]